MNEPGSTWFTWQRRNYVRLVDGTHWFQKTTRRFGKRGGVVVCWELAPNQRAYAEFMAYWYGGGTG